MAADLYLGLNEAESADKPTDYSGFCGFWTTVSSISEAWASRLIRTIVSFFPEGVQHSLNYSFELSAENIDPLLPPSISAEFNTKVSKLVTNLQLFSQNAGVSVRLSHQITSNLDQWQKEEWGDHSEFKTNLRRFPKVFAFVDDLVSLIDQPYPWRRELVGGLFLCIPAGLTVAKWAILPLCFKAVMICISILSSAYALRFFVRFLRDFSAERHRKVLKVKIKTHTA